MRAFSSLLAVVLLAAFMLVSVSGSAEAFAEVAIGVWQEAPSGSLQVSDGVTGTSLSLKNDMGYDTEYQVTFRGRIDMPGIIPNVYLMYTPMSYSGTGSKTSLFDFGGTTFSATNVYTSSLDMSQFDFAMYYGVGLDLLKVDLGLNVKVMDFDMTVTQSLPIPQTESKKVSLPLPMLFASVQSDFSEKFGGDIEIRILPLGDNNFTDLIVRARYMHTDMIFATLGYRSLALNIDESSVFSDIKFSGVIIEAGYKF